MGDRAQVHFPSIGVYLYTHWQGHALPGMVARALAREARWNDPEYLARIVFDEMVGDDDGTTGFGIGTEQHGDVRRVVRVDTECKDVSLTVTTFNSPEAVQNRYGFGTFIEERPDWPAGP